MTNNNLHGLLLVDKPSGITSHDVVAKIRHAFKIKEVGHTGTLDPLASGLMVVLLGEATKISQYILSQDKAYEVKLRFGFTTDSLDITGTKLEEFSHIPTLSDIIKYGEAFTGRYDFPVPKVSAVKVDGKKLYEYAREGVEVAPVVKPMIFHEVKYLGQSEDGDPQFSVLCSKGSFIRTWVSELASQLKSGAVMSDLRRSLSAPYSIAAALPLQKIQEIARSQRFEDLSGSFVPLHLALPEAPKARVVNMSEALIKNGQISYDLRRQLISVFNPEKDELVRVFGTDDQRLLAIVGVEKAKGFVIRRVFKY